MVDGLYKAARTMNSKLQNLEIIANNLANVSSIGFKREVPFSEYMAREENQSISQLTDLSEGSFMNTGNPLDLAIAGEGYFILDTNNGPVLTKNGKFKLTETGEIINQQGHQVKTASGNLNLYGFVFDNNADLVISKNGEIKIGDKVVDTLVCAKIDDPRGMKRLSGQNFVFPNGGYSIANDTEFQVYQGYLEESNTNAIMEMQEMIKLNKEYESAQKIIKSLDERMARAKDIGTI